MPLPRIIYAMAKDGLMFRFLAYVHPRFQTPVIATVISGSLAGIVSLTLIDVFIGSMPYYSPLLQQFWPLSSTWKP